MENIHDRLILGTAQFGLSYGIANQQGQISEQEARKILAVGSAAGVGALDTAIAYGNSELVLGEVADHRWEIISKLQPIPVDCEDLEYWVVNQVALSLKRLKRTFLDGLLLHRPDDLLGIQGKTLLAVLMHIKKIGLVKKIGVSIYSPDQLPALMDVHSFDIVQTPANILDQRIVHSGWANQLFKSGVEVHVRSVFLQGLLLMPNEARPEKFHIWHPVWNEWSRWLNASGMSAVEACLSYCLSHSTFNRVLVGVDSVEQLQQIIKVNNKPLSSLPNWPPFDQRLLNPALWNTI